MSQSLLTIKRTLAVMLACVALGTFGGCNLGMVQAARGGIPDVSGMILPGAIIGLLVGLIAVFWDKSWTKRPPPLWRRFALRFGYACVWLLLAVLSFRGDWTKAHNWTPVKIPLQFDKENTVSASFTAEMSETYKVQIDLKRHLPFEDINAFVGGWADPDKPPHQGPPRPEIVWTVNDVREADQFQYWHDQYWGETVGLEIGQFKAVAGHRYTVTLQVIKPSPTVQVLDPHLQIALIHTLESMYMAFSGYAQTGGMLAGIVGAILLIRSLVKLQDEQKENTHEAD